MSKEYVRKFKDISHDEKHLAGGKGASLSHMVNGGFNVPDGYVILSTSFENFLKENGLEEQISTLLKSINIDDTDGISSASESIKGLILSGTISDSLKNLILDHFKGEDHFRVAVRSSATAEDGMNHAWAGQLESYLNVTEDTLFEAVKKCWASLFAPRAIHYRIKNGLIDEHISVAVVVQEMLQADVAGVAFSVHPVTKNTNEMIIEACYGLGEALVSGSITPDTFILKKDSLEISFRHISTQSRKIVGTESGTEWQDIDADQAGKQKITDEQLLALGDAVIGLEQFYGHGVDIEWGIKEGEIYILQARPITTL